MSRKHRHRRGHRHKPRSSSPREVLYLFLRQGNISARNFEHIRKLTRHPEAEVKALVEIVLEIARIKRSRRRRMQIIAREHPDLFIDMVAVLDEEFWDDFFYRYGVRPGDWLWYKWQEARAELRYQSHASSPCWCGSGRAYWRCCAERDDAYACVVAAEEEDRKWRLSLDPLPWWHPDSGIDHYTRSAYEMYYIDSDHPFALTPPECRDDTPQEDATRRKSRKSRRTGQQRMTGGGVVTGVLPLGTRAS